MTGSNLMSNEFFQELNSENNLEKIHKNEWDLPIRFGGDKKFKFDIDVFPEWLSKYILEVSESLQSSSDMGAMISISVLSTALTNKYYVKVKDDWEEPLNTWTNVQMPPGSLKSPTFKKFTKPVFEKQKRLREDSKLKIAERSKTRELIELEMSELKKQFPKEKNESKKESIKRQILDMTAELEDLPELKPPQLVAGDVTPEKLVYLYMDNNEVMSILSSESTFMSDFGGMYSDSPKTEPALVGWSGDDYISNRVDERKADVTLDNPLLTVGIMVQPSVFKNAKEELIERGMLARFLYFVPDSNLGYRDQLPPSINEYTKHVYEKNINKLLDLPADNYELSFDEAAHSLFTEFRRTIEVSLRPGGALDSISAWASKFPGNIARIIGLLHIAEHIETGEIPTIIGAETVQRGIDTIDYFIEHTKYSFDMMGLDEVDEMAKRMLNNIQHGDKFKGLEEIEARLLKRSIHGSSTSAGELKEKAIHRLEKYNYVKSFAKGRKNMLKVSPHVLETG